MCVDVPTAVGAFVQAIGRAWENTRSRGRTIWQSADIYVVSRSGQNRHGVCVAAEPLIRSVDENATVSVHERVKRLQGSIPGSNKSLARP